MQNQLPQLWLYDLRPLFENGRWRALLPLLPDERRLRVLACRKEADAVRLAGAGFLLQQALLSFGIPVSRQRFSKTDWGKPYLLSHGVEFSLTHAGPYAACALDAAPVGVDLDSPRVTLQIAARWFHPQELSFAASLPAQKQADALLRLWTAREAYAKQCGCGLCMPPGSFCVELLECGARVYRDAQLLPLQLQEYPLDGFRLCLCCKAGRPDITPFSPAI